MKFYCFYCNTDKSADEFNKDHVLFKAFGTFGSDTPTFSEIYTCRVCQICNENFGNTLEKTFAKQSIEGLWRFHNSIVKEKHAFKKNQYGKNSNYIFNESPLKGLEFDIKDSYKIVPKKEVGLRRMDGEYDFFLLDDIPSQVIANKKYPQHEKRVMFLSSYQEASKKFQVLCEKWPDVDIQYFCPEKEYLGDHTVPYNKESFRTIAKNAFNYLAWRNNSRDFLSQSCFDPIRKFIKNGEVGEIKHVIPCPEPILYEKANNAVEAHICTIQIATTGEVVVSISFFNQINWQVIIAENYNGFDFKKEGHMFVPYEIKGNRVIELTPT